MRGNHVFSVALAVLVVLRPESGAEPTGVEPIRFVANDSLDASASNAEELEALEPFLWVPRSFEVTVGPPLEREDARVRFASPRPRGSEPVDTVVLEWYRARRVGAAAVSAVPAVLVLHILDGRMRVARAVAAGLQAQGIHAFVLHLPDYGERGTRDDRRDVRRFPSRFRQGVADARRARDAIAGLPGVDGRRIAIQGTSLGGFVAAIAGSLDGRFASVHLMLAGGDLGSMFENGKRDTAKIRAAYQEAGFSGDELRAALRDIDPVRLAHRLDPMRTWLYSARYDQVVPPANALALGRAARLDEHHHVWILADHYTGLPFLPGVVASIASELKRGQPKAVERVTPVGEDR